MQQVQDRLDFPIEVVSDAELERRYTGIFIDAERSTPKPRLNKNALKRGRKAQKRARRQHA